MTKLKQAGLARNPPAEWYEEVRELIKQAVMKGRGPKQRAAINRDWDNLCAELDDLYTAHFALEGQGSEQNGIGRSSNPSFIIPSEDLAEQGDEMLSTVDSDSKMGVSDSSPIVRGSSVTRFSKRSIRSSYLQSTTAALLSSSDGGIHEETNSSLLTPEDEAAQNKSDREGYIDLEEEESDQDVKRRKTYRSLKAIEPRAVLERKRMIVEDSEDEEDILSLKKVKVYDTDEVEEDSNGNETSSSDWVKSTLLETKHNNHESNAKPTTEKPESLFAKMRRTLLEHNGLPAS